MLLVDSSLGFSFDSTSHRIRIPLAQALALHFAPCQTSDVLEKLERAALRRGLSGLPSYARNSEDIP